MNYHNEIVCGECASVLQSFPDKCIDLTVTSPPYDNLRTYNGFVFPFEDIAKQLYRVTKDGGVVVWVVGDTTKNFCESLTSFKQAVYFVEVCGFNLLDTMIWVKPNYAPGYPSLRRYDNNFEYMFVFSKGKPVTVNPIEDVRKKESSIQRLRYKTRYSTHDGTVENEKDRSNGKLFAKRTNVWSIPNGQIRGLNHPAPFPEQLAHDHILSWSNERDVVLDPMCGSGTTLKMAKKLNRTFIGIDISEEYVTLARKRIELA